VRMATVFKPKGRKRYGCCSPQLSPQRNRPPAQGVNQRLRHGSGAPIAPSYCPEVVMPGPPVVVLQDGTVGTVMVPKQT
jgi:hypothetical protein